MTDANRFIVDTDLNFPSDDLQALLLLVSEAPERLAGVSACAGNTFAEECLVNIATVLDLCQMTNIPLAQGVSFDRFAFRRSAALAAYNSNHIAFVGSHQKAEQPRYSLLSSEYKNFMNVFDISDSLLTLLKRQQEPVDVICLGPLTNLHCALVREPSIVEKIAAVWIMGGNRSISLDRPKFDFNVWYDPWAAKTVFDSALNLKVFSYELCRQNRSDPALHSHMKNLNLDGIAALFVDDFDGLVRQHGNNMPLSDQLVALAYLFPRVVQEIEPVSMDVSLFEGPFFGSSTAEYLTESRISLATKINRRSLQDSLYFMVQKMAGLPMRSSVDRFVGSPLYCMDLNPVETINFS